MKNKVKKGDRFLNYVGEYSVVKSIYKDIVKIQMTGKKSRTETWRIEDFEKPGKFWKIPYPKINRTIFLDIF